MSELISHRWKRQFARMAIVELDCLRQVEKEHRALKPLVADLTPDKHGLQEVLRNKFESRPVHRSTPAATVWRKIRWRSGCGCGI